MLDPYEALGISRSATPAEVESAYVRARGRALAEAGGDERDAEQRLALLDRAFELIGGTVRPPPGSVSVDQDGQSTALVVSQPTAPMVGTAAPTGPRRTCPHCGALNPVQVATCGECGQQIMRECPACGHPVGLAERVCPRCQTPITEYDQRRFGEALSAQRKVQEERTESDVRVRALEEMHLARAWQGVWFWVVFFAISAVAAGVVLLLLSRVGY